MPRAIPFVPIESTQAKSSKEFVAIMKDALEGTQSPFNSHDAIDANYRSAAVKALGDAGLTHGSISNTSIMGVKIPDGEPTRPNGVKTKGLLIDLEPANVYQPRKKTVTTEIPPSTAAMQELD